MSSLTEVTSSDDWIDNAASLQPDRVGPKRCQQLQWKRPPSTNSAPSETSGATPGEMRDAKKISRRGILCGC